MVGIGGITTGDVGYVRTLMAFPVGPCPYVVKPAVYTPCRGVVGL